MEVCCDECESVILDERDLFEIEPLGIVWCESCMAKYMDGPTEDLVDDLADELAQML